MKTLVSELRLARPCSEEIGYGVATVEDFQDVLLSPEEGRLTDLMQPARRREFWMGRAAGHRALHDLGLMDGPILSVQRRPSFPAGVVGSLSHSGNAAVAIVCRVSRFASLGIDLELRPLPVGASRLILNHQEQEWASRGGYSPTEIFSAKEAFFKAIDPLLQGGTRPLRKIILHPYPGGFEVRIGRGSRVGAVVGVRRLTVGVLAWTTISLDWLEETMRSTESNASIQI